MSFSDANWCSDTAPYKGPDSMARQVSMFIVEANRFNKFILDNEDVPVNSEMFNYIWDRSMFLKEKLRNIDDLAFKEVLKYYDSQGEGGQDGII